MRYPLYEQASVFPTLVLLYRGTNHLDNNNNGYRIYVDNMTREKLLSIQVANIDLICWSVRSSSNLEVIKILSFIEKEALYKLLYIIECLATVSLTKFCKGVPKKEHL